MRERERKQSEGEREKDTKCVRNITGLRKLLSDKNSVGVKFSMMSVNGESGGGEGECVNRPSPLIRGGREEKTHTSPFSSRTLKNKSVGKKPIHIHIDG